MATWTTIADANLDPDKPARTVDAYALRDNPIAIAEGASGAPRVEDAALDTTATTAGRDWVLARTALAAVGAVGTYAFLQTTSTTGHSPGDTRAGSGLRYSDEAGYSGGTPSGTWRCMGEAEATFSRATLWLRIS